MESCCDFGVYVENNVSKNNIAYIVGKDCVRLLHSSVALK